MRLAVMLLRLAAATALILGAPGGYCSRIRIAPAAHGDRPPAP